MLSALGKILRSKVRPSLVVEVTNPFLVPQTLV